MKITAVILHYYPERTENIPIIVKDLRANSRPPDEVIVFNNNPAITYSDDNAIVINSSKNYGSRSRHLVALLEPSDYYYLLDDDVTVRKGAIGNFLKYAHDGCCYGYWGKTVDPRIKDCYEAADNVRSSKIVAPKKVDLLVGRGTFFVSFSAFKNMLTTEETLLKEGYKFGRDDDIILSMSNTPFVIPAKKDESFAAMPDGGVGYCHAPEHYELRNTMTKKLYKINKG